MLRWTVRWESEIGADDHTEVATLLRGAFPGYVHAFPGRRSWSGARPELRVLAHDATGLAAHAGVLRRFVQIIPEGHASEQLVATVGLVAVRPALHGTGVGRELGQQLASALRALEVSFGLLGCDESVAGYYRSAGWHCLPPTPTRYGPLDIEDPARVATSSDGWMLLPVTATLQHWPAGEIWWNGSMI